ncbi:MAG: DUF3473 domain-containing protein [Gammaproteobacteria bacterium]|nr:DUF3473 domain-containing protein [Gammaproteobacteria bacterium]
MQSKNIQIMNALTVDVEDYFQVSAFEKDVRVTDWSTMESRVVRNTEKVLSVFDRNSTKATFFVLGWVAERYPELVRRIASAGHEIACHGYSHQLIYNQSPEVFKEETIKAKKLLEDQVQTKVSGYRAASYSITNNSRWALDILAEAGFEYDSSIFPVHHDRYGIPDSPKFPYRLETPSGKSLVEFPLSTADMLGYKLPVAGGGYFRLYPYFFSKFALRRINRKELEAFIFYLHPWEVDPDQPKIKTNMLSRFRHYNNLSKCEQRLERLLKDFSFTTVKDILQKKKLLDS